MFDTLKFARALRDGGQFTPEQAERLSDALSDAISGEVVARADLEATEAKLGRKIDDLRADLDQATKDLRADLDQATKDLRADLAGTTKDVRAELKAEVSGLRAEIIGMEAKFEAAKADTIKWVVGIISFQSVAIIGAAIVLARILAR